MSSSPFLFVSIVLVLFSVGAFAATFPPSQVVWSAQQTYMFCNSGGFGWHPYETPNAVCREWPLVVSLGSPTLLILCHDFMQIGLTRTSGNSSSIEPLGLVPRSGNLTLQIIEPIQVNITFESRCENPAPAETIAHKNSWKLPNNANPSVNFYGPCCALEFTVPTNYTGDLYYQDSAEDAFTGQVIIEANVTSTTTPTPTPPNNTTKSNTTTDSGTTTTSTTTTTPPVPTSTPLPPNATTNVPTPTPTMNPTPTPTIATSTTSPPTTINSTNNGANSASESLAAYSCTVLTMLIAFHSSYFSVL